MTARPPLFCSLLLLALTAAYGGAHGPTCSMDTPSGPWLFHYISSDAGCSMPDEAVNVTGLIVTGSRTSPNGLHNWTSRISPPDCQFERTESLTSGYGIWANSTNLVQQSPTMLVGTSN